MTEIPPPQAVVRALLNVPRRGIASIIVGGFLLTAHDAAIKSVSDAVPVGQIIGIRGVIATLLLALLISWRFDWRIGTVVDLRGNLARAVLMIAGTFLFIAALRRMPLADAIAVAFVGPIMLTALAVPFLGEHVGWRRWTAVFLGFCGVIVMLRPTGDGIYWIALLPVGAALTGAMRDIFTRRLSVGDSSIAILFFTTAAVAVAGLATAPLGDWIGLSIPDIANLVLLSVLYCAAHFLIIDAFRYAQAGLLSTFRYLNLVWATVLGFAIWGHIPGAWTIAGAALVVSAGVLHRMARSASEARLKHAGVR
ncbi:MAG: DMT family transporter [Proteobacteria bacterium]|nr:DMT family transporter [Pseudomonadota bacterium]